MRILHTSDWHLGRTFHGMLLDDAHAALADHLLEVVVDQAVDAVLVPGDVYDRAVPPNESVALLDSTLRRLTERTRVVLTPGNHDSARRLGFASELLREGLVIQARTAALDRGIELPDSEGRPGAVVHALPYLDPDAARESLPPLLAERLGEEVTDRSTDGRRADGSRPADEHTQQDGAEHAEQDDRAQAVAADGRGPVRLPRSHEAVVSAALRLVAADLGRRRRARSERVPSVLMAHAFVVGGRASESERDIRVGGVDGVPSEVFTTLGGSEQAEASGGLDYVALGHLHRPQEITLPQERAGTGAPRLVYSGSPLAFSFEEADQAKSSVVVELGPEGVTGLERVPVPVRHPVRTLTGTMEELLSPAHEDAASAWVRVVLTGERPPGALATLKRCFPMLLAFTHEAPAGPARERVTVTRTADPVEVTTRFLAAVGSRPPGPDEREVVAAAHAEVLAARRSA